MCWCDRMKHLRCWFRSRNLDYCSTVAKFYGAFNNILNVMGHSKSRNELVALHLNNYSYCLPSMPHGYEKSDIRTLDIMTLPAAAVSLSIGWTDIPLGRTLTAPLNSKLTFDAHMYAVCKNIIFIFVHYVISRLPSLMIWPATSIAVALVHLRLDYANLLLSGISATNIHKLQRYQNTATFYSRKVLLLFNTS